MESFAQRLNSWISKIGKHPRFLAIFHLFKILQLFTSNILLVAADVGSDIYTCIVFHK